MVTDEALEKALDYLRDTAEETAKKRATRIYLDEYSRALRATIMAEHLSEAVNAQERYANSDIRYKNHLDALRIAIFEDEKARFLREAAAVKIEVYRTEQATLRSLKI
jgi:hypothetical protein